MILTIVGAGLIGTSFARAVRDRFDRINAVEPVAEHARAILAANDVAAVVDEVPAASAAILLSCVPFRLLDPSRCNFGSSLWRGVIRG